MIAINNKNDELNLYITFHSEKRDVTHIHYLKFPTPAIETKILKILHANLKLVKPLRNYIVLNPLLEYILYKYWRRVAVINKKESAALDRGWHNYEPHQPPQRLLELMRSC